MSMLIKALLDKLFEAEERRLDAALTVLNAKNKEEKGLQTDGFMFAGVFYRPKTGKVVVVGRNEAKPTLFFKLSGEMTSWLADQASVHHDRDLIRQTLVRVLKPCQSEQDIRNALPECLVSLSEGLKRLPRTDSPGFTLWNDERATRQFNKAVPKMEFYAAGRLMY